MSSSHLELVEFSFRNIKGGGGVQQPLFSLAGWEVAEMLLPPSKDKSQSYVLVEHLPVYCRAGDRAGSLTASQLHRTVH